MHRFSHSAFRTLRLPERTHRHEAATAGASTVSAQQKQSITMLVLALACLPALLLGVSRLLFPYDTGQHESGIWAPAQLFATGTNPYARHLALQPPYVMAPYGPVYYALVGAGLRVFGTSFAFGRALSLLGALLIGACLGWLTWRETRDRNAVGLGVALFGAQFPVQYWLGIHRPDFLALGLGWLGLCVVIAAPRRVPLLLPALLQVAAIGCRQTTVLPLAASLLWLWLHGRRREAWQLGALVALALAIGIRALDVFSQGGYQWQTITLAATMSKSLAQTGSQLALIALSPATWLVCALAALSVLLPSTGARLTRGQACFWPGYALLATLEAALTSSRRGSNLNYWIEACLLGAFLAALGWHRYALWAASRSGFDARALQRRFALAALVLTASTFGTAYPLSRVEADLWRSRPYFDAVSAAVARLVPPDAPCYSVYPDLLAHAHRRAFFNDHFQYEEGEPSQRALFARVVASRRLAALISQRAAPPPGYRRVQVSVPTVNSISLDIRADLLPKPLHTF